MAVNLLAFLRQPGESFTIRQSENYHDVNDFSSHAELEVLYVKDGAGTLLVGDEFHFLKKGDLVVIGSHVPHFFRVEREAYHDPVRLIGKFKRTINLVQLHFDPYVFGEEFIEAMENAPLRKLLKQAKSGFRIEEPGNVRAIELLEQLLIAQPHEKLIGLLGLINHLASVEIINLSPVINNNQLSQIDEKRLTEVMLITVNQFKKRIKLNEIASSIHLSPNAFCNYFKEKTGKTYFDFLLSVRIHHACKLLRDGNHSVVMICWDSGFTNLSNFNRQFRAITGQTPMQYRQQHRRTR